MSPKGSSCPVGVFRRSMDLSFFSDCSARQSKGPTCCLGQKPGTLPTQRAPDPDRLGIGTLVNDTESY